tara:strand:- start:61 stop:369 length:309 start_codon:yes stop_codon:yes gene_type:complete
MNKEFTLLIQDLIFQFVKYHYDQYRKENKLEKIINVEDVVEEMYNSTKKKEMVTFIRTSMKQILKEKYNTLVIESIITEIIDNDELAKRKIIIEIEEYQNQI